MRNTLRDLNNHLFEQLERLNDEELVGNKLKEEIERAKSISCVAEQIVANGNLVLKAQKFNDERLNLNQKSAEFLEG